MRNNYVKVQFVCLLRSVNSRRNAEFMFEFKFSRSTQLTDMLLRFLVTLTLLERKIPFSLRCDGAEIEIFSRMSDGLTTFQRNFYQIAFIRTTSKFSKNYCPHAC